MSRTLYIFLLTDFEQNEQHVSRKTGVQDDPGVKDDLDVPYDLGVQHGKSARDNSKFELLEGCVNFTDRTR